MRKSAVLLLFPVSVLALAAIGLFVFSPEPEAPGRTAHSASTSASDATDPRSRAAHRSKDEAPTDRSSTPGDQSTAKRPPVGSVFAPPQTSRTGSFSPASPRDSRGGGDAPRRPVGGKVLGDATGFEVDPGVPIPAVLSPVAPEVGLSETQKALNQRIATEFAQRVDSSADPSVAWPVERARADNRFRLLFGEDLYRRQAVKAVREARDADKL